MIYDKATEVLLALDERRYLYSDTQSKKFCLPVRCFSCELRDQERGTKELHIIIHKRYLEYFYVACSGHLEEYLNNGWELYE